MQYINDFFNTRISQGTAVTVGKFDGMHRGHELLLDRILEKSPILSSCMVTFDTPPRVLLNHEPDKNLITKEERRYALEKKHLDYLLECPFTEQFMKLSPEEFVRILVEHFSMRYMVVGSDFSFGYKGAGTPEVLNTLSKKYDFRFEVVNKIKYKNRDISSTFIREDIEKGNIQEANELLGYPYFIWGRIVHGNHIGTGMGIPTINQVPPAEKLLPPNGVYISEVEINHKTYHGITDVGVKPTVENAGPVGVETHILDFTSDVYEEEARVLFLDYVRPEIKFDSLEDLKAQIRKDTKKALEYFNSQKV